MSPDLAVSWVKAASPSCLQVEISLTPFFCSLACFTAHEGNFALCFKAFSSLVALQGLRLKLHVESRTFTGFWNERKRCKFNTEGWWKTFIYKKKQSKIKDKLNLGFWVYNFVKKSIGKKKRVRLQLYSQRWSNWVNWGRRDFNADKIQADKNMHNQTNSMFTEQHTETLTSINILMFCNRL